MDENLLKNILNSEISFFDSVNSKHSYLVSIALILNIFKSNKYFHQIQQARNCLLNNNLDGYKKIKSNLPVVTFSGVFKNGHGKNNLITYNNIIVLDIDKLSDEQLETTMLKITNDEYVFASWISPSNQGIKCLVYLLYDSINTSFDDVHKQAFVQLCEYFKNNYDIELDKSGSDISRLCFVCCDNDLHLKNICKPFVVKIEDIHKYSTKTTKEIAHKDDNENYLNNITGIKNVKGKNDKYRRNEISSIIKFLKKNKKSITYSYSDWVEVAFAIVSTFNFDLGKKYFLELSKLDVEKYNEVECIQLLHNCYIQSRGEISFGSILYKAQQLGYKRYSDRTKDKLGITNL